MFLLIYGIFLIFVVIPNQTSQMGTCQSEFNGSTPQLEQIFKGKCYYYINVLRIRNCDIQISKFNCNLIWDEFSKVILNKNPCDVNINSFDRLMQLTNHSIKPNTSLFWSGTNHIAHESINFRRLLCVKFKCLKH